MKTTQNKRVVLDEARHRIGAAAYWYDVEYRKTGDPLYREAAEALDKVLLAKDTTRTT